MENSLLQLENATTKSTCNSTSMSQTQLLSCLRGLVTDRKPGDVVLRDRSRAVNLWLVLIAGIVACESFVWKTPILAFPPPTVLPARTASLS